ncbi:MAG: putative toxin-antitoxin system toxin component, PIN family [Alphaproteobacteria bacterium]|nr:putative toxin-antitoxin system toxin component, PIN family [Alphaproteobacteria bacterium]
MSRPRTVPDTNVALSALLFRTGSLGWLRGARQVDAILSLTSRDTAAELIAVLSYPKLRLDAAERDELLGNFLPWCEVVAVPAGLAVPDCRDPLNRPFLELALAAGANALLSGDRDMLDLAGAFTVPILPPAAFRIRLGGVAVA